MEGKIDWKHGLGAVDTKNDLILGSDHRLLFIKNFDANTYF